MLSYRHSYHAGNFADVFKHIVLVEILQYLMLKDGAVDYIDTNAGAGLFRLDSDHALKLQEHKQGISRLQVESWPQLSRYLQIVQMFNGDESAESYPGSPLIATRLLRPQDRAWLFELHPADFELLRENTRDDRRVRAKNEDGYKGMLALLPPVSRRALVLIDPSYEVKSEYTQMFDILIRAYKKFATGIYALWYPVVERSRVDDLVDQFASSDIKRIQRFELCVTADSAGRGMTGSGMLVINPPYLLMGKMSELLPQLVAALAAGEGAFSICEVISGE